MQKQPNPPVTSASNLIGASGALDIDAAAGLKKSLLDCFAKQSEVVLDLNAVERCDLAGLQLLLAARKSALASAKVFRVQGASPAVTETAAALGIVLEGVE